MTETNEYSVFPALRCQPSRAFELHVGAEAKVVQTKGGDSLVEQQQVYGSGKFGEAGVRAGLEYDSRGRSVGHDRGCAAWPRPTPPPPRWPRRSTGVRILAEGFFVPKGWDVTESFGGVDGSVAGYLGNQRLALATRVGGRALWGAYPWFESASISGDGATTCAATTTAASAATRRCTATPSCAGGSASARAAVLPLRWGLNDLRASPAASGTTDERLEEVAHRLRRRAHAPAHRHADGPRRARWPTAPRASSFYFGGRLLVLRTRP